MYYVVVLKLRFIGYLFSYVIALKIAVFCVVTHEIFVSLELVRFMEQKRSHVVIPMSPKFATKQRNHAFGPNKLKLIYIYNPTSCNNFCFWSVSLHLYRILFFCNVKYLCIDSDWVCGILVSTNFLIWGQGEQSMTYCFVSLML